MAEKDGQEKSEQATGKKLSDAREEGQVPKSQEINSLAVFTTGLLILFYTKEFIGVKLWNMTTYIFTSLDTLELSADLLSIYALQAVTFFISTVFESEEHYQCN